MSLSLSGDTQPAEPAGARRRSRRWRSSGNPFLRPHTSDILRSSWFPTTHTHRPPPPPLHF
ncbi:hypothetical protein Hanom_Chr02g00125101 [Helianthus anomalus]